jgi:hypothetical protein
LFVPPLGQAFEEQKKLVLASAQFLSRIDVEDLHGTGGYDCRRRIVAALMGLGLVILFGEDA